jgi:flagellar protein FliO/FliZ
MFENLFGTETPLVIGLCLALLIVFGLIGAVAWAAPLFGSRRLGRAGSPRLSVIDSASVDRQRRFILIRRDNVEHLLMIGGPTDVIVEANIQHATAAPLEVPMPRSPASPKPLPNAIPQLDKGSTPLLPKPAAIPPTAPQNEPLPQEAAAGQLRVHAESTGLQRQSLAALANELSTRPSATRKSSATVVRPQPIEPRTEGAEPDPELRSESVPESQPEHRVEPQPELPMGPPQPALPAAAETAFTEIALTADEELARLARLLEAKLREPNVPTNARPSAAPARVEPLPQRAPAAQALPAPPPPQRAPTAQAVPVPPPLVRVRSLGEPKPPGVDAKPEQSTVPSDSLEQQLSNLLGRPTKH